MEQLELHWHNILLFKIMLQIYLPRCEYKHSGLDGNYTNLWLSNYFQPSTCFILWQEGSQETVATMVGMAFGMLLARITMGHSVAIWFSFLSLTMFHMYGKVCFNFWCWNLYFFTTYLNWKFMDEGVNLWILLQFIYNFVYVLMNTLLVA